MEETIINVRGRRVRIEKNMKQSLKQANILHGRREESNFFTRHAFVWIKHLETIYKKIKFYFSEHRTKILKTRQIYSLDVLQRITRFLDNIIENDNYGNFTTFEEIIEEHII